MATYRFDHIHLHSPDPAAVADYYRKTFGARVIESVQLDGQPRFDVELGGLMIFIARVAADAANRPTPDDLSPGLAHFGLRVDNLDSAVAELRIRGARIAVEPYVSTRQKGLRVAFVDAPDNVRIELLERDASGSTGS